MVSACGPAMVTFCRADLGAVEDAVAIVGSNKVRVTAEQYSEL